MKLSFLMAGLILTTHLAGAQEEPLADDPSNAWAFGDLYGPDEGDESLPEDDEYLTRARTRSQLQEHASRKVQIVVHKSIKEKGYQFVTVSVAGVQAHEAPVSTAWERQAPAKTGKYFAYTPVGKFFPDGMLPRRFSKKWQVWLEHVIPFTGGVWMHATTPEHFKELGGPASGGCVRLYPKDAEIIYGIVAEHGLGETAITVLPADPDEKQVPWNLLKLSVPDALKRWRSVQGIK